MTDASCASSKAPISTSTTSLRARSTSIPAPRSPPRRAGPPMSTSPLSEPAMSGASMTGVPRPGRLPRRSLGSDLLVRIRQNIGLATAIGLFCVVYLFYHLAHPKGFSSAVFVQNADEVFTLAMVAMAQTLPVLAAGLDLSVGAVMTMVGCIASYLLSGAAQGMAIEFTLGGTQHVLAVLPGGIAGMIAGMLISLIAGTLAGFLNGCVVVYGRIQPIIATLATGPIYIGIALFLRPPPGGKIDEDLNWALTNSLQDSASTVHIFDDGNAPWFAPFGAIPVPFVLIVLIALLVWVPFR